MNELKNKARQLRTVFDLGKKQKRVKELEEITQKSDFWKNTQEAAKISEELAGLKHENDFWNNLDKEIKDIEELYELGRNDKDLQKEIEKKLENMEKEFKDAEIKVLFSGKYDNRNAIISIYSGAGGTEAQDWANMLLRMYSRYAENHKFKSRLIDVSYGQEAGIKNAILEIDAPFAYGYLKGENGVHRLVRLSPFNADNLRHTSFALVEILPEISEDIGKEMEIKPDDLKIDTFRSSGPGGQNVNMRSTAVRITHLSTNVVVSCQSERSQAQNKERAMKVLYTKVYQKKLQEKKKEKSEIRGELLSAEWGSQIRSYVLHPYKMVKDHRTECESSNPEAVLDGKLDEFIEAEIRLLK
ncbi:MAG: peptide chain release factor 2 [bacterium]|nr:peptide chain release factor 2 [bacterium]